MSQAGTKFTVVERCAFYMHLLCCTPMPCTAVARCDHHHTTFVARIVSHTVQVLETTASAHPWQSRSQTGIIFKVCPWCACLPIFMCMLPCPASRERAAIASATHVCVHTVSYPSLACHRTVCARLFESLGQTGTNFCSVKFCASWLHGCLGFFAALVCVDRSCLAREDVV